MVQKFAHIRKKQYLCTVKFDTAKVVLNFQTTKFLMKKIKFFDIFMKKTRILTAIIFIAIALTIIPMVCIQWHIQGCQVSSLIAAIMFYSTLTAGMWYFVDLQIKEHYGRSH